METYLVCSLTLVIHLKLNHDTLREVVSGTLELINTSTKVDSTKALKKVVGLTRGDTSTVLALKEEKTWRRSALGHQNTER